nr:MAG TPA: hypothetical protein [Caudoviricetes sp.]
MVVQGEEAGHLGVPERRRLDHPIRRRSRARRVA